MRCSTAPSPILALIACIAAGLLTHITRAAEPGERASPEAERFFTDQVQPILKANCFKCHGDVEHPKGNLRLTSRSSMLRGGDTGPAVSIEDPGSSLLLEAINYGSYQMPPSGKLPPDKIAILTRWVESGLAGAPQGAAEVPAEHAEVVLAEGAHKHWAFQRLTRPGIPQTSDQSWIRTSIDAFVLRNLEAAGLRPNPPAAKADLIRRAYYDLIGLPPTPDEVQQFVADQSPQAYEHLIDRLLQSPHYGEKWGRHWLDLVRYAETNSYERDGAKPYVWRYRDYVIRAFNADQPYDEFIREQLAGDELDQVTADGMIATGYYRLGIWDDEPSDPQQALYDDLDGIVATTSQVFLGLTLDCARCHDHKLDPLLQEDYYRLLAFFNGLNRYGVRSEESVAEYSLRPIATDEQKRRQAAEAAAHQQHVAENKRQIAAIEALVQEDLVPVEREEFFYESNRPSIIKQRVPRLVSQEQFQHYKQLLREQDDLRDFQPAALEMALCVTEIGHEPRVTNVLIRGNPHVPGQKVEPGFPRVLQFPDPALPEVPEDAQTSGRRRVLADWIASADNPLTARVMANRIWQYHFGSGLVRSPNNFGLAGDPPTHPELLDWLASEFIDQGWRMKGLHKLIMLSSAYRMSSQPQAEALARDPENQLLWRFNMRRLTAEEIRDSILAVNGTLNLQKMYGPSIYPIIPEEVLAGQSRPGEGWKKSSREDRARRSVYIHVKRSLLTPILESFDTADTDNSCPVRFATTQPTQALGMLNSDFINRQAEEFAEYVRQHAGPNVSAQVELCLERTLQRPPDAAEIKQGMDFLAAMKQEHGVNVDQALTYFCLLALNLNEFIYLD